MLLTTLLDSLREIERTKSSIEAICDTITDADIAIEILNKKQIELKKQLIDEVHVTKIELKLLILRLYIISKRPMNAL